MALPILLDTKGRVADNYGVRGFPAHILIDKNGLIRAFAPGYKNMTNKSGRNLIQFIMDNAD